MSAPILTITVDGVSTPLTAEQTTAVLCGLRKYATDCDAMADTLLSRSSDTPDESRKRTEVRALYRKRAAEARALHKLIHGF